MAKLVDALVSGTSVRKDVQVRVLFWALLFPISNIFLSLFRLINQLRGAFIVSEPNACLSYFPPPAG